MCDTMVAVAGATAEGRWTLFAKNSDREFDEPQHLVLLPRARHPAGSRVRLTHVEVEQVPETAEVLLSKPFWMWGAEMGANEHGVVIGNEAVHGILPASIEPGVLGMDLLRLTLERAHSAAHAVEVLTGLLERYGQGGDCSRTRPRTYNNSFIIADAAEAWVLESLGRHWIAERVRDVRSISNVLSIGPGYDKVSPSLLAYAREQKLTTPDGTLDFAARFRAPDQRRSGVVRYARSSEVMRGQAGRATVAGMFAALRDHGVAANPAGRMPRGDERGHTICMHPDPTAERQGHSAGAWVSQLAPGQAVHWVTATAAPCLGVFKPVFPDCGLPPQGPVPDEREDPASRWWWHEKRFRPALEADDARRRDYRQARDALEARFIAEVQASLSGEPAATVEARRALMLRCWDEADALQRHWVPAP